MGIPQIVYVFPVNSFKKSIVWGFDLIMLRVSVLVPTLNYGHFLSDNLSSIASQIDEEKFELQVVIQDGGSRDNTTEIVRDYSNRFPSMNISFESRPDGSQAVALNEALKRCDGDFIMWLNADETLRPGAISRLISTFKADVETNLVVGNLTHLDIESNVTKQQYRPWFPKFHIKHGMLSVTTCSMMVKRECFDTFRFDSRLRGTLDLDFFSYLERKPGKWKHCNFIVAINHLHPAQITYPGGNDFSEELNFLKNKYGISWGEKNFTPRFLYKFDCLISMITYKFRRALLYLYS